MVFVKLFLKHETFKIPQPDNGQIYYEKPKHLINQIPYPKASIWVAQQKMHNTSRYG